MARSRELAEYPEASHSIVGLNMDGVLSVSMARAKFGAMRASAAV